MVVGPASSFFHLYDLLLYFSFRFHFINRDRSKEREKVLLGKPDRRSRRGRRRKKGGLMIWRRRKTWGNSGEKELWKRKGHGYRRMETVYNGEQRLLEEEDEEEGS